MFCKFCGKEIPDNSKYCPSCGGALSGVGEAKNFVKKNTEKLNKIKEVKVNRSKSSYLLYAGIASFVINLFLHFSGIISYRVLFDSETVSLFGALSTLGQYDNDGTFVGLGIFLWTGPLLMLVSAGLWAYKVFFKKNPKRNGIIFVILSVLYSNFLQMMGMYIAKQTSGNGIIGKTVAITGAGGFLIVFALITILCMIASYVLMKKEETLTPDIANENVEKVTEGEKAE